MQYTTKTLQALGTYQWHTRYFFYSFSLAKTVQNNEKSQKRTKQMGGTRRIGKGNQEQADVQHWREKDF